jgi:uncharacterized membrane protein (UPF0127 family)
MPSFATAKTAWAHKHARVISALIAGVALLCVLVALLVRPDMTTLQIGSRRYSLEVAATPAARAKGLGGRVSIPQNSGMLFIFAGEDVRCFWMKDTLVPLDMMWLGANKRVLHVEQNVQPSSYPAQFCPSARAQYVIELDAGQAAASGIRAGETLTF